MFFTVFRIYELEHLSKNSQRIIDKTTLAEVIPLKKKKHETMFFTVSQHKLENQYC